MKLSERIRNLGRDAADWGFDDEADEVAVLESRIKELEAELFKLKLDTLNWETPDGLYTDNPV